MANSDNNFLIKFKPDYIPLQEYIIDTKRLEHANTYSVIVTHVKNPSFLWAYLKDEDRDLKRLNFQLEYVLKYRGYKNEVLYVCFI